MNHYEITFILNPEETESKKGMEIINSFIKENEGTINDEFKIGIRKTAYYIKKHDKAYYYRLDAKLEPKYMKDLDHLVRVSDPILKYMPINLDKDN